MQETQARSLCWEDTLEKEMATLSSFLPGKSHGQRSLAGYSPQGCKELDTIQYTHILSFQDIYFDYSKIYYLKIDKSEK